MQRTRKWMWHDTNLAHNLCKRINLNEFGLIKQKAFYYHSVAHSLSLALYLCEKWWCVSFVFCSTAFLLVLGYVCVFVCVSICIWTAAVNFLSETIITAITFFWFSLFSRKSSRLRLFDFVAKHSALHTYTHIWPNDELCRILSVGCFSSFSLRPIFMWYNYLFRCWFCAMAQNSFLPE